MRTSSLLVVSALAGLLAAAAPAGAAPLTGAATPVAGSSQGGLEPVHWRRWRHCDWRHGHRRCHGARGYGNRYYDRPRFGFYLNLGDRNRQRHHRRRWN